MVLWQSPDTPILSGFSCECAASSVLESCALSSAYIVLCGAWCLDPGTHVLSFGSCRGSDTRAPFSVIVWFSVSCPRVFCCVARSSCFYRLHAFMLYLVLCGTQRVHVLFCTWLVICLLAMCLCFCFMWARGFCPSFLCATCSCQFVLTPPILLPVYWLIFPSCFPSLPSSFAPFIISLCLQFHVGSLPYVRCRLCPALSSPVQPCLACQPASLFFPYGVVFVCLFYYCIQKAL